MSNCSIKIGTGRQCDHWNNRNTDRQRSCICLVIAQLFLPISAHKACCSLLFQVMIIILGNAHQYKILPVHLGKVLHLSSSSNDPTVFHFILRGFLSLIIKVASTAAPLNAIRTCISSL